MKRMRQSLRRLDPGSAAGRAVRLRAALIGVLAVMLLAGCAANDLAPAATAPDAVAPASSAGTTGDGVPGGEARGGEGQGDAAPEERAEVRLTPGQYLPPLARLQRLEGEKTHLHVDEVRYRASDQKLFQCSYTFGVVNAKDPANMTYLAQNIKHKVPDDERSPGCIHLAWDGDIVYTTHRGNLSNPAFLSGWDISKTDPKDDKKMVPEQIPVLQEPGVSYEGIDVADGIIYVALAKDGLGVYERDPATNVVSRVGELKDIGSTWGLRVVGTTAYLTTLAGELVTVDVTDPTVPRLLGKADTGGVARGLAVDGTMAYVAAGSAGLVLVDASVPTAPKVVGQAPMPGTAIRVDYSAGRAFVAAWNDARAYDVSDPTAPKFIGAARQTQQSTYGANAGDLDTGRPPVTVRNLGIAAHEDIVFIGNWWVLYSYRMLADRTAPNLLLPEDANTIDFGLVAAGETRTVPLMVTNQGTAPLNLFGNWTEGEAFTVSPEQVQVGPGMSTTLQLSYTAAATDTAWSNLHIWSDDPDQPKRTAYLTVNREGLGIGRTLPETKVTLLDGSEWSTAEGTGNVQVLAYFATF
ncbi:MAG: hypothetical protein IT332_06950 [Ardenticatenales bacterium]|nr:hypothetical protein [Ardenticatenales bacterium]